MLINSTANSRIAIWDLLIGPFSSMASPMTLMIRPRVALPTGTCNWKKQLTSIRKHNKMQQHAPTGKVASKWDINDFKIWGQFTKVYSKCKTFNTLQSFQVPVSYFLSFWKLRNSSIIIKQMINASTTWDKQIQDRIPKLSVRSLNGSNLFGFKIYNNSNSLRPSHCKPRSLLCWANKKLFTFIKNIKPRRQRNDHWK